MTNRLGGARIGVLGLARSGVAAARLALAHDAEVYASDSSDTAATREAAARIRALGGEAEAGRHDAERLATVDQIVISPGIPPTVPILQIDAIRDIPVISELELASRCVDAPLIAVTGTNGKTTVTGLLSHLLQAAGLDAPAGGNIGLALSEVALRDDSPDWIVVEASSFQLGRIETFRPTIGVITNLSPDHLDWYDSLEAYYADKAHLFDTATVESRWVLNGEDPQVLDMAQARPGRVYRFRVESEPAPDELGGFVDTDGHLILRVEPGRAERFAEADDLPLLGRHNMANILAAGVAARLAGVSIETLRSALGGFHAPAHRMESLGEIDGVLWVNDSKATNAAAARVSIESMTRPTVLLAGGKDKGEDLAPLAEALKRSSTKVLLAFGEAGRRIARELDGTVRIEHLTGSFGDVVERARSLAEQGDAVLLAPGCSSFDMFADYEERGDAFRRLAREAT